MSQTVEIQIKVSGGKEVARELNNAKKQIKGFGSDIKGIAIGTAIGNLIATGITKALEIGVITMKTFAWPYYGIPFTHFGPVESEKNNVFTPSQTSIRWILRSSEIATITIGINNLRELDENIAAINMKGEDNETLLEEYLENAKSLKAKEKLQKMQKNSTGDISHYAKQAINKYWISSRKNSRHFYDETKSIILLKEADKNIYHQILMSIKLF